MATMATTDDRKPGRRPKGDRKASHADPVVSRNRYPLLPYRPPTETRDRIAAIAAHLGVSRNQALNACVDAMFSRIATTGKGSAK